MELKIKLANSDKVVVAERIALSDELGIELAIHSPIDLNGKVYAGYVITEISTGYQIGEGTTAESATVNAHERILKYGIEKTKQLIKEKLECEKNKEKELQSEFNDAKRFTGLSVFTLDDILDLVKELNK